MRLKPIFSQLVQPLSGLYSKAMKVRNELYENEYFSSHRLPCPVVSVGNITMGGTGKTPFVAYLLEKLISKNKQPLVLSRGYGRKSKENLEVEENGLAEQFGDEPLILKNRYPKAKVYVGAKRYELGKEALQKNNADLVIADDAFQHRSLARDLNIVLIDATEPLDNYKVLPSGRLREPLEGLERADILIYTKVNLVSEAQLNQVKKHIEKYISQSTLCFHSEVEVILPEYSSKKVLLVTGVAKPNSVEASLKGQVEIVEHLKYKDHHVYTQEDIDTMLMQMEKHGLSRLLTTEKDAVKLKHFPDLKGKITTSELRIKVREENEFDDLFSSLLI